MLRMFRIEAPVRVSGEHWGLVFTDGVAETSNAVLAENLAERGYIVTEKVIVPLDGLVDDPTGDTEAAEEDHPGEEVAAEEPPEEKAPVQMCADECLACPICGKVCASQAGLTRHLRTHDA